MGLPVWAGGRHVPKACPRRPLGSSEDATGGGAAGGGAVLGEGVLLQEPGLPQCSRWGRGEARNSRPTQRPWHETPVGAAKLSSSGHGARGGLVLSQASPATREIPALASVGSQEGWTASSAREGSEPARPQAGVVAQKVTCRQGLGHTDWHQAQAQRAKHLGPPSQRPQVSTLPGLLYGP